MCIHIYTHICYLTSTPLTLLLQTVCFFQVGFCNLRCLRELLQLNQERAKIRGAVLGFTRFLKTVSVSPVDQNMRLFNIHIFEITTLPDSLTDFRTWKWMVGRIRCGFLLGFVAHFSGEDSLVLESVDNWKSERHIYSSIRCIGLLGHLWNLTSMIRRVVVVVGKLQESFPFEAGATCHRRIFVGFACFCSVLSCWKA